MTILKINKNYPMLLWITSYFSVLIWSGTAPKDMFTWILEVIPAMLAALVLALTYKSFRLTKLVYILILIHCIILMIGGHYTYAEVPVFNQIRDLFGLSRNNYDKLGHFAQGFVPAIIAREIIVRKNIINGNAWQFFFIVSFCLGFSAFYELIEWAVALTSGQASEAFLGTQGYEWDTQSDMGMALAGALSSLLTLRKLHDRQLLQVCRSGYID